MKGTIVKEKNYIQIREFPSLYIVIVVPLWVIAIKEMVEQLHEFLLGRKGLPRQHHV